MFENGSWEWSILFLCLVYSLLQEISFIVGSRTRFISMPSFFHSVHLTITKLLSSSFHVTFLSSSLNLSPSSWWQKVLFAVNTFLISCPATLRCERKGIKICIIPERNRAVTPWTQGRGEQLLAWRAVNWQHLLWQIICSPTSHSASHVGREAWRKRKGLRCKRQAESDGVNGHGGGMMEDENGNGATWDGEKWEQEIERVIHLAGGGVKISKVENEAGRWREMVQIGETRWDGERGGGVR